MLADLQSHGTCFDSLIAQQDRHDGNWRWDGNQLTLIDHYTFALPGAILNYSDFVVARHRHRAASLLAEEHDALARLLSDSDLLGLARFLLPDRAQALADRAQLMLPRQAKPSVRAAQPERSSNTPGACLRRWSTSSGS